MNAILSKVSKKAASFVLFVLTLRLKCLGSCLPDPFRAKGRIRSEGATRVCEDLV